VPNANSPANEDPARLSRARGRFAGPLRLIRRFGPLLLLVAALLAVWASGLTHDLSLHMLRSRRDELEGLVHAHPLFALAAYAVVYVLVVALSLPAALVMTLTGGLLFGVWLGGLAAAMSCTLGSAVVFLVCRTAAGDVLRRRAGSTVARVAEGVRRDAFSYVVTLRLIPIMPFWLANLALGFVEIPLGVFMAATFVGILPVSLVYAGLGANLNMLFARHERPDLHIVLRPEVLLPLIGLTLLALTPIIARHLWRAADD
jgi:uncharacterized membrane protein YdjX (TVP38/TMEM64 family)